MIMVFMFLFISSSVYAAVVIEQDFEGGGTGFVDETNGTLTYVSLSGSTYVDYKSDAQAWASSLKFASKTLDSGSEVLTFDYKFEDYLAPQYNRQDVDFGMADYFRVSILTSFSDFEIFKHALTKQEDAPEISSSLSSWSIAPSLVLPGFTRVTLELTDFIASNSLENEVVDIYIEISNGYASYFGQDLDYSEFNTTASVDNIFMGAMGGAAVPEPGAYALFMFGIWFLVKRVKSKLV